MEVAGFAIGLLGAVGIIGHIFDGCMKGYKVFSTASNLGRDSERLTCKIKIEETRLWLWGREWGIVEGKFEAHLAAGIWGHDGLKDLAVEILTQLLQTIMDCNKLQEKYGLREEAPGSVDKEAYQKGVDIKCIVSRNRKNDLRLRARWVIADKDKFEQFLDDLQYYNDRLEKLFPPSRIATFQRTWTNEVLQRTDLPNLETLQLAANTRYPGLNAMAKLKQLRINLDAAEPSRKILSSSELKIPRWRIQLPEKEDLESRRVRAIYQKPSNEPKGDPVSEDIPVLIDWIPYDQEIDLDARLHLYQRVDNLSRMLHSGSSRHPDLSTLDCVGYVDDTVNHRYGIVHLGPDGSATPSLDLPKFSTLTGSIENSQKKTPDLDVRFRLAHSLAVALWSFHSLDWLHKSFSSSSILFFHKENPKTLEQYEISRPYVVGFDSSRPDGLTEMTADPKFSTAQEIYRHPDSLGVWRQTYRKSFDIYSLGLVLLEVGLWKSIYGFHKAKYSPAVFKERIIHGLVPALGSKAGAAYRRLVLRCLTYDETIEEEKGLTPHQLMEWLVYSLESLKDSVA
ncbi:hypothetical protein M501DRAFT_998590 [Patellaria atrata CBS 101060]|uniref:Protein kinase domain-containing protein n=1 Tax=Patellaria atrata CBS 101060 TaxID=1346257 RepID=A0A9P4SIQ2_9PEZI|nr:hypothetical protein M501DRAFT_998590 [Patellaria atrata CBS 101060]